MDSNTDLVFCGFTNVYHNPKCGMAITNSERKCLAERGELDAFVKKRSMTNIEAISKGYRPCSFCKKEDYNNWKETSREFSFARMFCSSHCDPSSCKECKITLKEYKEWLSLPLSKKE